jgi:malonyl CoA-acyl carrier protein transacylase
MSTEEDNSPNAMTQRMGFGTYKSNAMTNAERQRKFRAANGGRTLNTSLAPEIAAALIYLKKEWGMETDREAVEAAVRFLTLCTRQGLTRLPQSIDD